MAKTRLPHLILFVGTNGTGKTTQMMKFMAVNQRNLIVTPSANDKAFSAIRLLKSKTVEPYKISKKTLDIIYPDINKFVGSRKIYGVEEEEVYPVFNPYPQQGFEAGGLFLDDFKSYISTSGPLPGIFKRLFGDRRHKELDICMAAHSWRDVNPEIFSYQPTCFVFFNTMPIEDNAQMRGKIVNLQGLLDVQNRVNQINQKFAPDKRHYFELFKPAG